jgi:hypothetical protein
MYVILFCELYFMQSISTPCLYFYYLIIWKLQKWWMRRNNLTKICTVDGQIKLGHLKFNLCKSDY